MATPPDTHLTSHLSPFFAVGIAGAAGVALERVSRSLIEI
jgi:hypothetical protein